jgi:hypothetical protein
MAQDDDQPSRDLFTRPQPRRHQLRTNAGSLEIRQDRHRSQPKSVNGRGFRSDHRRAEGDMADNLIFRHSHE